MNLTLTECASRRSSGLLAHEVEIHLPEAVGSGTSLKLGESEEVIINDVQGLDMHAMITNLVAAVQAQQQQIEDLKGEVKALKEA
mmetsp:Transcript_15877/g.32625  ORF Transcript_15877/g.32625 Transcript_15877/m.32625 type:complete len:85 (-) Transcript_15877:22-276(-)